MRPREVWRPTHRRAWLAVSAALLLPAAFAVFIAFLSYQLLCDENCTGRPWELTVQLAVAIAGLAAVALAHHLAGNDRWLAAGASIVAGIVLYAIWAVLLDAATHGWGHGPVPF